MSTYGFGSIAGSISGPGLYAIIGGAGTGSAEEGVSIEPTGDKSSMVIGADGFVQHSLSADQSGSVTVRVMKTSPLNAILQKAYNSQTASPLLHGRNTLSFADLARGDLIVCEQCAFKKAPTISYSKDGGMNEWTFDAGRINRTLGVGTPEI